MHLQQASRKNAKIKMALQGPAGAGKTYGALLVAFGLTNDWAKIAVIDTENHSSELYAHLGSFMVLHLESPFSPERYVEAIQACERAGMQVIVIDSISHEWEGIGGILQAHSIMTGNSYTNWAKLTPRHNLFVQQMLQSPLHIIGTIRSKQEYILAEKNGKQAPEKVGMKGVTREGMDYEFTLVFEIDMKNTATATKDRTSVFRTKPPVILTPEIGKQILAWCSLGFPEKDNHLSSKEFLQRINGCKTIDELLTLYYANIPQDVKLLQAFSERKASFETKPNTSAFTNNKTPSTNGTYNHTTTSK